MNGDKIIAKVAKGRGKVGQKAGFAYAHYRRLSPTETVIDVSNLLGEVYATFNAQDQNYTKPNKYGQALWWGDFDYTNVNVGDFLVGDLGTFFVASKQAYLPVQAVNCNRVINIANKQFPNNAGGRGYIAVTKTMSKLYETPCSILQSGGGKKGQFETDGTNPNWNLLLPDHTNVTINALDWATDDLGRNYIIQNAELTDLGWRCDITEVIQSRQVATGVIRQSL